MGSMPYIVTVGTAVCNQTSPGSAMRITGESNTGSDIARRLPERLQGGKVTLREILEYALDKGTAEPEERPMIESILAQKTGQYVLSVNGSPVTDLNQRAESLYREQSDTVEGQEVLYKALELKVAKLQVGGAHNYA